MTPINVIKTPRLIHSKKMLAVRDVFLNYEYEKELQIFFFIRVQVKSRD